MNRPERRRRVLSRPWWVHKELDPETREQIVSLVGYGMRQARTERIARHRGRGRPGRGLVGYPRFGR